VKYCSFSLYGDKAKYIYGAIENAKILRSEWPDWIPIYYVDLQVPSSVLAQLESLNAEIRVANETWHKNGMFWRFDAIHHFDFDHVIFRDADSRISRREMEAVDQWIDSRCTLHIMRDHPWHNAAILGGMWGASSEIRSAAIDWDSTRQYGQAHGEDQRFLREKVYPYLASSRIVHDSFFKKESETYRFPSVRYDFEFVGESYNEFNLHSEFERRALKEIENAPALKRKFLDLKYSAQFRL